MNLHIESIDKSVIRKNTSLPSWIHRNVRNSIFSVCETNTRMTVPSSSKVFTVKMKKDLICAGLANGAIETYTMDGELIHQFRAPKPSLDPVYYTSFHPKNSDIFYASDASGHVYVMNNDKCTIDTFITECHNEINTFDISRTGRDIITGGKDGILRNYDTDVGKLKHAYAPQNRKANENDPLSTLFHKSRIFKILFHPDETNTFLTGGWDDCLKVWDIRTKKGCMLNIPGPKIYGDAIDVRENIVLTGSWTVNESLKTYDMRTGDLLEIVIAINRHLSIDGEFVNSCQFLNSDEEGDIVVSATTGLKSLEIISISEKKVIHSFPAPLPIYGLDTLDDDIVFGGMDNTIYIAEFNSEKWDKSM